jgi:hypothetical protein
LKFVLGSCNGGGLVADDVIPGTDEFPRLLGGDSTCRALKGSYVAAVLGR